MELVHKIIEFAAPVLVGSFWILAVLVGVFKARETPLAAKFIEYISNAADEPQLNQGGRLYTTHHSSKPAPSSPV